MGAFEYAALDSSGKQNKGVIEGDTPRQVRQLLRERGLTPLNVEAVTQREKRRSSGGFSLRLGQSLAPADLALVTRQLATLVRSGTPLEESLATVARQCEKARLQSMLMAVRARVVEGHTLADGLADFPHAFPDLYRSTVAAGERSGHLDSVLERLADYTEGRQQMRQKIQLALFYPLVLSGVAILVVLALLAYVVPEVVQVFDSIGRELPWLTRALIASSDFLANYGLLLLLAVIAAFFFGRWLLARPGPQLRWHRFLLRLPMIASLIKGIQTARFARTLSILGSSGVTILEALRIAAEVLTIRPMRRAVDEAAARVREGGSISKALERSGYFPPMMVHLVASGESSGKLDEMLDRAAINQEREVESRIAMAMGVFEPLLILLMGVVVLIIVLAILLPIFDLNQVVR